MGRDAEAVKPGRRGPPAPAGEARRRRRRARRRLAAAALLLPSAWIVAEDLLHRGDLLVRLDGTHAAGYLATAAGSAAFWACLLHAASGRRRRTAAPLGCAFLLAFVLAAGVEGAYWSLWSAYCTFDAQIYGRATAWALVGSLPARPGVLAHFALAAAVGAASLVAARRVVRPRRRARELAPWLTLAGFAVAVLLPASYRGVQSSTPDALYLHGLAWMTRMRLGVMDDQPLLRVQGRHPAAVPPLARRPARPRNVLFLLQESQRYDVTCVDYDPACALATRASNLAAPARLPLHQLRANDSATAVSVATLWTGLVPTASLTALERAPLLWEYAHAAGYDTAYWTSQHLNFCNNRLFVQDAPLSHLAGATHLDRQADLDAGAADALLTDRVIRELGELREPYYAVVHYANQHFPYRLDPQQAPFVPYEAEGDLGTRPHLRNFYMNVVYLSDLAVGRLIRHVRGTEAGSRTLLIYTADHGEALRERLQLGHTSSVYDEQIHTPAWVDAPPGTLAPEEEQSLRQAGDQPTWHVDLAPTVLDLLGVWDDPALAPFRAGMIGNPLTRPQRTTGPVPLSNCAWVWECSLASWGLMRGPEKLLGFEGYPGEPGSRGYRCFDVLADPGERKDLGPAACRELRELAHLQFPAFEGLGPPRMPLPYEWRRPARD